MTRKCLALILCLVPAVYGCAPPPPEMQLIIDAAEAMGGERPISELESLLIEGDGRLYRLGQNTSPANPLPYFSIDSYVREIDLVNNNWRVVERRTSSYLTGNPINGREQTTGSDGDVAYNITEDGAVSRASAKVALERQVDLYDHPAALIKLALTEGTVVGNLRQEDGQDVVDITAPGGQTYTMYVDSTTKFPTTIATTGYDTVLGDVTRATHFEDYFETGGFGGFAARLTLPRGIGSSIDDFTIWELRVDSATNRELDDLSAPGEAQSAPVPEFRADVQVEEVGDGLWLLAGQSHHSLLVEFDEYLALVEAPQNDVRTLAVIAAARELQPEKPLQYVVTTHHHFDHAGGIRAAISEGLTVVTHESNAEFYQEIAQRPHTIMPDALANNPQELVLALVANEVYELGEGRRTLEIARVRPDAHTDAMLVAYLPRERTLVEVDLYAPTYRTAPFAANLLRTISDREWRVENVLPLHGSAFEISVLEEAAETESTRP